MYASDSSDQCRYFIDRLGTFTTTAEKIIRIAMIKVTSAKCLIQPNGFSRGLPSSMRRLQVIVLNSPFESIPGQRAVPS